MKSGDTVVIRPKGKLTGTVISIQPRYGTAMVKWPTGISYHILHQLVQVDAS